MSSEPSAELSCATCELLLESVNDVKVHEWHEHHGTSSTKCEACITGFTSKEEMMNHLKAHYLYCCNFCSLNTNSWSYYKEHVREHCKATPVDGFDYSDDIKSHYVNDNSEKFKESYLETTANDRCGVTMCAVCHRISTSASPLHLFCLTGQVVKRICCDFSFLDQQESLVCYLCYNFISKDAYVTDTYNRSWAFAWPSVLWSYFSGLRPCKPSLFLKLIPVKIRNMWDNSDEDLLLTFRRLWDEPSDFVDVTDELEQFRLIWKEGHIVPLMHHIDQYCFPTVRCPMGCCIFMDDLFWGKAQLIPFHHYMAKVHPHFNQYDARAQIFQGARPDWCKMHESLSWQVAPSLVVDSDVGLAVIACSKTQHVVENSQYIHVPQNPVLGNIPRQFPDEQAPVVVTPNFVRSKKVETNRNTTSFSTVRLVGNVKGFSTFRLAARSTSHVQKQQDASAASGLVLENRPDVLHHVKNSPFLGPDYVDRTQSFWDSVKQKYPQEKRDVSLAGATFLPALDASHVNKLYKECRSDRLAQYTPIVYPMSGAVQQPFIIVCNKAERHKYAEYNVVYTVLQLLLHCRPLHHVFLHALWQPGALPIYASIHKKLSYTFSGSPRYVNLSEVERGILQQIKKQIASQQVRIKEVLVAHFLNTLGPSVAYHQVSASEIIPLLQNAHEDVVLVVVNGRKLGVPPAPLETPDGHWSLHLATLQSPWQKNHVRVAFRWAPQYSWQFTGSRSNLPDLPPSHGRLLVYAHTKKALPLKRDDVVSWCGGQTKIRCSVHETCFLIREGLHSDSICCYTGCSNKVRWRCPHNFPTSQCKVGLCFNHQKQLDLNEDITFVQPRVEPSDLKSFSEEGNSTADHASEFSSGEEDQEDPPPNVDVIKKDVTTFETPKQIPTNLTSDSIPAWDLLNGYLHIMSRNPMTMFMNIPCQKMLQHICSFSPPSTVPLLYPEATLFTSIFWLEMENTIVGALPAGMYSGRIREITHRPYGLASVPDHMAVRMYDDSLLTSHDEFYLNWTFDVLVNKKLAYNPMYDFKGLEYMRKRHGVIEPMECMDEIHSKQFQKLTSLMHEVDGFNYFLIATCDDLRTFGVRTVRQAIVTQYGRDGPEMEHAIQSYCAILCRCWERTIRYFLHWIEKSPQAPCGDIDCLWARNKFHSDGTMPQLHVFLKVKHEDLLPHIPCKLPTLLDPAFHSDINSLIQSGIIADETEYTSFQDLCQMLHVHDCSNGCQRCQETLENGDIRCREQDHCSSVNYCFCSKANSYDTDVLSVMRSINPAHSTAQQFQVNYCWKYANGCEEHQNNAESTQSKNQDVSDRQGNFKHEKSRQGISDILKEIGRPEMAWFALDLPFFIGEVQYTIVKTLPPECRVHVGKNFTSMGISYVNERLGLSWWRQFTPNQIIISQQRATSGHILDATWLFSVRPPELMVFNTLASYAKWFKRAAGRIVANKELHHELSKTMWVDCTDHRVLLRHRYVSEACTYIQSMTSHQDECVAEIATELNSEIFSQLLNLHEANIHSELYLRFVDVAATQRNVVIFSSITPFQFPRFIVHLLLSMGHFATEFDLYTAPNLKQAMVDAELLPSINPSEDDINNLIRAYIVDQLRWLPMENREIQDIIRFLPEAFHSYFADDCILYDSMPLATNTAISVKASDKLQKVEQECARNAVQVLSSLALPDLPDAEHLIAGTRIPYKPNLTRAPGQSEESYQEQLLALNACLSAIDRLEQPIDYSIRFPLLLGPPGAGKTYLLLIAQTYAMAKGFRTMATALTSERARVLGGIHIHYLFVIQTVDTYIPVTDLVELSLRKLARKPVRMEQLCRLQVLIVDEIGLIAAEIIAVIDMILRRVRKSPLPFGGVLILASGDPLQLLPVNGLPIWTSSHLSTTFKVLYLKNYVRSAEDQDLRHLIHLLGTNELTPNEIYQFFAIINRRCSPDNFVAQWKDVGPNILRVLPTNEAVDTVVSEYIELKKRDSTIVWATYHSVDEVELSPGHWVSADDQAVKQLNSCCAEPSELFLFKGAVMRLTFNNNTPSVGPRFSQGQLCVINSLPAKATDKFAKGRVNITLVPPGQRTLDVNNMPASWSVFDLAVYQYPGFKNIKKIRSRRIQWPLQYNIASTIHRIVGETCDQMATQLSLEQSMYTLWDRSMLLVLISRVRNLNDLTFVGPVQQTKNAIASLLRQTSPLKALMEKTLDNLDVLHETDSNEECAFVQLQQDIPDYNAGFVYMLASTKHPMKSYCIGETGNIRQTLTQHNSVIRSQSAQDKRCRPWCLYTLVVGFPGNGDFQENKDARKEFLRRWQTCLTSQPAQNTLSIREAGLKVFHDFKRDIELPDLQWLECGRLQQRLADSLP